MYILYPSDMYVYTYLGNFFRDQTLRRKPGIMVNLWGIIPKWP